MSAAFSSTTPRTAIRSRRVGRSSSQGISSETVTGRTTVMHLKDGVIRARTWTPEQVGLQTLGETNGLKLTVRVK